MIKKFHLRSMPTAQCHVEIFIDDIGYVKEVRLVSYTTTILSVQHHQCDADIKVNYPVNCSATTARHVNRFTTELFGTNEYHKLKRLGVGCTLRMDGCAVCISDFCNKYQCYGKKW